MVTKYLPPNMAITAYKEAEENNLQGYILECIDVFDIHDDDLGMYYVYCKDVDAVISFLGRSKHYIGKNLSQVYDCCAYVLSPKALAENGYSFDLRIGTKEWLQQNKVDYELSPEGLLIVA